MININIKNRFMYYNGTNEIFDLDLNFKKIDDNTLKCVSKNLILKFENNSLTIENNDDISYTKIFSLESSTISSLKLNDTIIHTKIHTIKYINKNNKINIKAIEYSMNDEILAKINIDLQIKEENNG